MMADNIKLSLASGEPTPPLQLSTGLIILVLQIKSLVHYPPTMIVSFILFFQKASFLNPNMRLFINFEYHITIN